jgi:hypothetical protein
MPDPTNSDREEWDMSSKGGSLCFASAILSRLVGGELDEAEVQWLAAYLRANSTPPRPAGAYPATHPTASTAVPCNSDYMNPSKLENQLSKVCCFLDELDGRQPALSWYEGYHPSVYCKPISKDNADQLVKSLCEAIQKVNIADFSLEMQIWWRDHQAADRLRVESSPVRAFHA